MHKEQNIVESIMSMCLDVTSFTKDNMNARKDSAAPCDHPLLEAKPNARGKLSRPKAPYYLKLTERKEVLMWLNILKFSDRYAANIKREVNVGTGKLNGLKNHDYHIFLERLMPIMFCGYFKANLQKMFAKLSYFYRQICSKQVSKVILATTASDRILAAFRSRLLASSPTAVFRSAFWHSSPIDGSGLLAVTDTVGAPPGGQAPTPFGSPLWRTPHRPTTFTPPTVRQAYVKIGFVCLLDYFIFLTHLFICLLGLSITTRQWGGIRLR
jgi:hypothetical protein